MSKRLPFPIFMILIIIYFILLTKIPTYISTLTKLPGWSLLLPLILLSLYTFEKISKLAPEKIEHYFFKNKLATVRRLPWSSVLAISAVSILEGIFLRKTEGFGGLLLMTINLFILIALQSRSSPKQENEA